MNDEDAVVEIRISQRQINGLVDRLITDTEFRERLAQDPNAELRQYGISIPAAAIPEHVALPSPDELRRLRDELEAEEEVFGYLGKPFFWVCLILSGWRPRS